MISVEAYDRTGMSVALDGASRAAVLLLALGPTGAGRVLRHFSPDDIRALRRGAATQSPVSAQELDALVFEFQEAFKTGPGLSALDSEMQKLLKETLSEEQLATIFPETPQAGFEDDAQPLWPRFEEQGVDTMRAVLVQEHLQIVANVLPRLSPQIAALIVSGFEPAFRNDVLRRLLVARPLTPAAETMFETSFRNVHVARDERKVRSARHAGLAEIVNRMDKPQADELLASLAQSEPDDYAAVRRLLFAFEDLPQLSRKSLLVLFDDVQSDIVTTALTGAEHELRETVLSALAARARRMVEAELAQPRDITPDEVQSARRSIAALALRLANEGRIALPSADA